jgi:cell division protein FtsL
MYREAFDVLKTIDVKQLNNTLKINYYNNYKEIYGFYSSSNNIYEQQYKQISDLYRDSLLSVLTPGSNHYLIVYSEKLAEEGKPAEAEAILTGILTRLSSKNHEFAVLNYAIAGIYRKEGSVDLAKKHYALAAEADIRNAIKENAAMQALAILMYETGDLDKAYEYIKCSLEDAIFCNARMRTVEISAIFPIIDTAYQEKTVKQKNQMKRYFLLTGILSFFLIMAVGYVYKQMKKLSVARKELHNINLQLNDLNSQLRSTNNQLKETNHRLFETNRLKEEYIGHFLDLCSTYIDKLENYRKMLLKKASASQWETLYSTLKSKDFIDEELKALYNHFDNIFLHLFPNFTEEFNQLLLEEERFILRPGELLNPELRIFALIRLGISDSYKIAAFLHYSASTIYNYRTKVRNKAAVPRDNFENLVMKIGAFSA